MLEPRRRGKRGPRSDKPERILSFLRVHFAKNLHSPSVRDIQRACGLSSTSVVDYNLNILEREGHIQRGRDKARMIFLADQVAGASATDAEQNQVSQLIAEGESDVVEFKSTMITNRHTRKRDKRMEWEVAKTVAAFLNTHGGTLVIGVEDDGTVIGIRHDNFENDDSMSLRLAELLKVWLKPTVSVAIRTHFFDVSSERVLVIRCERFTEPTFVVDLTDNSREKLYTREGTATREVPASEILPYIRGRFPILK